MPIVLSAWPANTAVKPVICAYFMIILSFLSALLAVRLFSVGSFRAFCRLRLARQFIVITLIDSWLFCWASAVILFGVGSSLNDAACEVGIWWCIALYASSKALIYLFLMERLNVVHANIDIRDGDTLKDRFRSWWYRIAAVLLVGWGAVGIAMCVGRNAVRHADGTCMIGLKVWATVPMLTMDAVINIYLTTAFVYPVLQSGFNKARTLVRNSCIAAIVALVTSFANILILAIMKGHQQSWLCLTSCVSDVAINAAILFFITRYGKQEELSDSETALAQSRKTSTDASRSRQQKTGRTSLDRPNTSRRVSWAPHYSGPFTTSMPHTTHNVAFDGIAISRIEESCVDVEKDFEERDTSDSGSSITPPPRLPADPTQTFGGFSLAERNAIAPFSNSIPPTATCPDLGSRRESSSTRKSLSWPNSRRASGN